MIRHSHQTVLEFGNGTLILSPCISEDGRGALCINNNDEDPRPIGDARPSEEGWDPLTSDIICIFNNLAGLDQLIKNLNDVRKFMYDAADEAT